MTVLRSTTFQLHVKNEDGTTKMRTFTRAVSDADDTVKKLNEELGDNVTVTTKVKRSTQELTQQARLQVTAMERANKMYNSQVEILQHQINLLDKSGEEQAVLNAQQRLSADATEEQRNEVARLAQEYYRLQQAQGKQQGSLRNARGIMQNFGWQMQDTIVQLQMGTSAFVVLSQQGSQMAAAIGPGGAVLGAVIALAGVVAGSLAPSLFDAGNESEKLEETFNSLSEIFDITNNQIEGLNDEFVELYRTDQQLAELKLSKALIDLNDSVQLVKGELTTTFNDLADNTFWDNFFGIDNLKQGLREVAQVQAGQEVTAQFERLAEQFNITTEEAEGLLKAKQEYEKTSDIEPLLNSVTKLYNKYGTANTVVTEFALAVTTADRRLKLIKDTLGNNVDPALSDTTDNIYDAIDAWTDKTIALGQNARQQAINTALLKLDDDAKADEIEKLVRVINLYYDQVDALEVAEKASRKREKASRKREKQTEEEARELEKLERALDRVTKKSGEWNKFTTEVANGAEVIDKALKAGLISGEDAWDLYGDFFENLYDNIDDLFDNPEGLNIFDQIESSLNNMDMTAFSDHMQAVSESVNMISGMGSMMSSTIDLITNGTEQVKQQTEDMTSAQKAMFFVLQSISAAQAVINGLALGSQMAANAALYDITGVSSLTWLQTGAAIGGAQAGAIVGTTFAGAFDDGGHIPSGQSGIVSEYGDELVNGVMVRGPADVTSRVDTAAMMGGTNMYVDVQNFAPGVRVSTEKLSEDRVRVIVREEMQTGADDMVSSALNKPGSKSQKSVTSNFSTSKRYS